MAVCRGLSSLPPRRDIVQPWQLRSANRGRDPGVPAVACAGAL